MKFTPEGLARASSRRPWATVALWLAVIAAAGFASSSLLDGVLTTDANFTNDPEAKRALELVEDRFGEKGVSEIFIVSSDAHTVDEPAFERRVVTLGDELRLAAGNDLMATFSYFDTQDESLVSEDRDTALIQATFVDTGEVSDHEATVARVARAGNDDGAFDTRSFGAVSMSEEFSRIAEEDLAKGETFGVLVALVVLLAVFGAVVAGLVPIAMAIAAIAVALGVVALVGQLFEFSFFVANMVTMMGLAVGIDYSLFIVSRYREERARGLEKLDAIAAAGATASRAVFFSGMTVVLALVGMLIIPTTIFRSLAAGAIFVVVAAILASLTLLPALLGLIGDRVNSLRVFRRKQVTQLHDGHRFWDRITHSVMKRPVASLILGAGLLLVAAFSYLDINTGFSGVSALPEDSSVRQSWELLARDFSGGQGSPLEVVVDGEVSSPEVQQGIEDLQLTLSGDEMFGPSSLQVSEGQDLAIVSAPVNANPSGEAASAAVERVREQYVPAAFSAVNGTEVLVGGEPAFNKDFFDLTDAYTPVVFIFVLGLSFLLLMVVFRSIVVPIKAIIMNLLSVGAAYGLIVLVFQKGVGADLFGFREVESIEAWLPLFLFSVLFGLSMDYHVFLLTRIRERFDHTGDNADSVAYGLRTTGGLITGAALIMVAVFAGFASGSLVDLQQMGFGLGVAVLIDATIVRSILVPASMKLLGERNWYLPRWLSWLPNLNVEGTATATLVTRRTEEEPTAA